MERWEALMEGYPSDPTLRDFSKAVECARVVLKQDLAPFEIDWLLQTLLLSPVNALSNLSSHYHDDAWSNVIGRCLELLTTLVTDFTIHVQGYMEDIVTRCTHQYSIHVRKRALQCLSAAATRSGAAAIARVCPRVCGALAADEPVTARAVRAQLVGTICEYHPELLESEKEVEIWRVYLTILEGSKTTDSLTNGVLLGLNGLFKHFGGNLPTNELNNFYEKLSAKYLLIYSCQEACLQLLSNHSHLFPERVSVDRVLRDRLWGVVAATGAAEALVKVYEVTVNQDNVRAVATTEIYPRTASKMAAESNAANRIMADILQKHYRADLADMKTAFDKQVSSLCTSLEFALGSKLDTVTEDKWEYDHDLVTLVQQASWCIESGQAGCDALLRSVLLLYPHMAPGTRQKLVVHTLLKARDSLRTAAITFLISDSCALSNDPEPVNLSKHLSLFRDMFDARAGKDRVVMETSKMAFDDVIGYVLFVLRAFAEREVEIERPKERLCSLLQFASQIMQIEIVKDYLTDYVETLLDTTLDCSAKYGVSSGLVQFVSTLVGVADEGCMFEDDRLTEDVVCDLKCFYQSLRIDRCVDESLLCSCCLALTHAPDVIVDAATRLQALQVIFSRADVEPRTLSLALRKFERILLINNNYIRNLDDFGHAIGDILARIATLASQKDVQTKEGKILHREVLMFLGKYGGTSAYPSSGSGLSILKEELVLSLPNTLDGSYLKINLKRTLELALTLEEPKSLHSLMLLLCTNLSTKADPLLQEALTLVIYKLAKCNGRGETDATCLQHAVLLCRTLDSITLLVQYITSEKSPGVRKILSAVLETSLAVAPHSDGTGRAVRAVTEQAVLKMAARDSVSRRAGLDLVETIVTALKENDKLTVDFAPNLLVSILKTDERGFETAYKMAADHFLDKIVLCKEDELVNTANLILESVNAISDEVNLRLAVQVCMETTRDIFRSAKWNCADKFLEIFSKIFSELPCDQMSRVKYLLLLAKAKEILDFDVETSRKVVSMKDFAVFNILKDLLEAGDDNCLRTVFATLGAYSEVCLEVKYVMTIELLGLAITKSCPKFIKKHHQSVSECIKIYQRLWRNTPQVILGSFQKWFETLPVNKITDNIERKIFTPPQAVVVYAMKKMLLAISPPNIPQLLPEAQVCIKKWPTILMHQFASNYLTDLFKSKMADLTDILTVSFYFLTVEEVVETILEGWSVKGMSNEKIGLRFCQYFVKAFAPYLLRNEILLREDMKCCALLVQDLIKYCSKYKTDDEFTGAVMRLLNELWPTLQTSHSFNELHNILTDVSTLKATGLGLDSNPGLWWLAAMTGSGSDDERVKLMTSLPVFLQDGVAEACKESYFAALQCYSQHTARVVRRGCPPCALLLALLQASAAGEESLLHLGATCLGGCTPKWLETSLQNAMAQLASKQDVEVLKAVYRLCDKDQTSVALYERMLVPLIRHSSTAVCVDFFAATLGDALRALSRRARVSPAPRAFVALLTRALLLAACAFEKLPLAELQSPNSRLYSSVELKRSATIAQELCKLCATLRSQVQCPEDAGEDMRTAVRSFQTANLNCLATVFCRVRPSVKLYNLLLEPDVLAAAVDCTRVYRVHIDAVGRVATVRHSSPDSSCHDMSLSSRATVIADRTLSDNPLAYDFLSAESEQQEPPQTVILPDNALNDHPSAAILTAAIRQLSALQPRMDKLEALLYGSGHRNVLWLVTQIVINCRRDLSGHSFYLTPAFLHVVATTPFDDQGRKVLNGLHVNALNTLINWSEEAKQKAVLTRGDKDHVQTILDLLLSTCVHHKGRHFVLKSCMSTLNCFTKLYGEHLHGNWAFFEEVLMDKSNESLYLEMLMTITKNKVRTPELLPKVLEKLESKQSLANKLAATAELYGLALASSGSGDLSRFWKVLERLRTTNSQDYVKLLFYAQSGFKECCNEINFRHIAALTPKMLREQKSKCFEIIAGYVTRFVDPNEYINDMFESIDLCDTIAGGGHGVHALRVAKNGLRIMPDTLKRRVVFLACDVCTDSAVKVRKAAIEVVLEAFKDIFAPSSPEPPAKRPRPPSTKILSLLGDDDVFRRTVVATAGKGLLDTDEEVGAAVETAVLGALDDADIGTRFCEALLITITLPSLLPVTSGTQTPVDVASTLSVVLKLFYSGLTGTEAFRRLKLREEPLESTSAPSTAGPSKLLTMGRTYQGTFRTQGPGTLGARRKPLTAKSTATTALNVQIPLQEIVDSFLQLSLSSPDVSVCLLTDTVRALIKMQDGGNADSSLTKCLASQMTKALDRCQMNQLTPVLLELCRLCVDDCCAIESFKSTILKLKSLTARTNGEDTTSLLYEEVLMRESCGIAALGARRSGDDDDEEMSESKEFCLEGLVTSFGKLADWSQLTLRDKRQVQKSTLWPLWTDHDRFTDALNTYQGAPEWLSRMQQSLRDRSTAEHYRWMRLLDRWPVNPFAVSAITEAIEWHSIVSEDDMKRLPCGIKSADCLAEWAARLQMRSAYLSKLSQDSDSEGQEVQYLKQSRVHELAWCKEANRRDLPKLALQCVRRNAQELHLSEMLPWIHQQVSAMRTIAVKRCNDQMLHKALVKTETLTDEYQQHATTDVLLAMKNLNLQLHRDLKTLSGDKMDAILDELYGRRNELLEDKVYGTGNRRNMVSIYEIAMCYYDEKWEQSCDAPQLNGVLTNMAACLSKMAELHTTPAVEAFVSVLLNRLGQYTEAQLPDDVAELVLSKLDTLSDSLNGFIMLELKRLQHLFPALLLSQRLRLSSRLSAERESRLKSCLQLVCDPEYCLRQYVEDLAQCLTDGDAEAWEATYSRMESVLDNPYAGSAFQLLNKHRPALEQIKHYEIFKAYQTAARQTLRSIHSQLSAHEDKVSLNLTQLCPALADYSLNESEGEGDSLRELFGLKCGVQVVRFEKQVQVIAGSIRRPCILTALLSNGRKQRHLVKRGEPLRMDAAATKAQQVLSQLASSNVNGYMVTPLSDDCALIEYLECHVTLRSMIPKAADILRTVRRPADPDLILASSSSAMKQFEEICLKVPAHTLRFSIEESSLSTQDFLQKRQKFTESLCMMTICHWILGVGDRHLDNYLYNQHSGSVLAIDWGSTLKHCVTSRVPELPPARLTRNLVAVCGNTNALESRLETILTSLRSSYRLLMPTLKVLFRWMSDYNTEGQKKMSFIEATLLGKSLPYHVTRGVLDDATLVQNADRYVELLEGVFEDWPAKEIYGVEDQITCLLRQCTDPKILSITRSGWEPWL